MTPHVITLTVVLLAWPLSRCDQMTEQQKLTPYASSQGTPAPEPPGIVDNRPAAPVPPVTLALLQRGQSEHHAFCAPCHGELGNGNGMVVQRGFPAPPSYEDARLRNATPQALFDTISNGKGAMYGFAAPIQPPDRWAVIAYIKALEISQNTQASDIPPDQRQALQ